MERLKQMSIFARVAELGSFTAVARQLHISVSAVSQIIARLEDELQIKLLNRSTRSTGLTEAGKIYYQGCRRMLNEASLVHEQIFALNNNLSGTLRIGSSTTMAQNVLATMSTRLLAEYPSLKVNLISGHPTPDLIAQGLDLVIKTGELEDSSLFAKLLGSIPMSICAASSYLQKIDLPSDIAKLSSLSWLEYTQHPYHQIELYSAEEQILRLSPEGRFSTNDPQTLIHWLKAGAGIAFIPIQWVMEDINRGNIQVILPEYRSRPRPVYALYTAKDKLPLKVQVCIEYLSNYFKQTADNSPLFRKTV